MGTVTALKGRYEATALETKLQEFKRAMHAYTASKSSHALKWAMLAGFELKDVAATDKAEFAALIEALS